MADFSASDALAMAAVCQELARRSRGADKVRSRATMALDALAILLDDDVRQLPSAAEIGAVLELIEEELGREVGG